MWNHAKKSMEGFKLSDSVFLASPDALEVIVVTHLLTHSLTRVKSRDASASKKLN